MNLAVGGFFYAAQNRAAFAGLVVCHRPVFQLVARFGVELRVAFADFQCGVGHFAETAPFEAAP